MFVDSSLTGNLYWGTERLVSLTLPFFIDFLKVASRSPEFSPFETILIPLYLPCYSPPVPFVKACLKDDSGTWSHHSQCGSSFIVPWSRFSLAKDQGPGKLKILKIHEKSRREL